MPFFVLLLQWFCSCCYFIISSFCTNVIITILFCLIFVVIAQVSALTLYSLFKHTLPWIAARNHFYSVTLNNRINTSLLNIVYHDQNLPRYFSIPYLIIIVVIYLVFYHFIFILLPVTVFYYFHIKVVEIAGTLFSFEYKCLLPLGVAKHSSTRYTCFIILESS